MKKENQLFRGCLELIGMVVILGGIVPTCGFISWAFVLSLPDVQNAGEDARLFIVAWVLCATGISVLFALMIYTFAVSFLRK